MGQAPRRENPVNGLHNHRTHLTNFYKAFILNGKF